MCADAVNKEEEMRLDTNCLGPAPRDTGDSAITSWCDGHEERVGDVDGASGAYWAGVDDFALDWADTVIVDVNVLVAVGVVVGVGTVCHVSMVHGDEEIAVGAGETAGGEADRDIVVSHVTSVCSRTAGGCGDCLSGSGRCDWRNISSRG